MKYCFIVLFSISICTTQEEGYIDSSKVRDPGLAWKIGFIPGIGQLYNGKYFKSIGFIGAEYYAVTRFIELKYEGKIGLRNTYAWWIFGLFFWNILDSYVDAHLSTFPVKRLESSMVNDSLIVKQE